jgi:spore coat protein U-like protein
MRRPLLVAALLLAPSAGEAACSSLSVTSLLFGTYTGSLTNSTATVTVNCTFFFPYQIALGSGNSGTVTARTLNNASAILNYGMYQDSAHTQNWGNVAPSTTVNGTGTGFNQTYTIYGQLPAGQQLVTPGSYTDNVTAAVVSGPSSNLAVSATVQPTCSFTTTTLAFGTYTGAALSGTGTLVVTCTNTTPYQMGINTGLHGSGAFFNWNMAGPSGALANYSLFRDSAHTMLWGGTIGTGGDSINGTGSGAAQTITFYGAVPAGQAVTPGAYTDTVNVILYY